MGLHLAQIVAAIVGLGLAAFGFVDSIKVFGGGPNHIGFRGIRRAMEPLIPDAGAGENALSQKQIVATLQANWMNGAALDAQKSIARSLIKLKLNPQNASALAATTGVDPGVLTAIASAIATGASLTSAQSDVYSRFDLVITAIVDEAYQRSDQIYRNCTRALAAGIAVVLSLVASNVLRIDPVLAAVSGLLAAPIAPIAKDMASALAAIVNSLQLKR